MKSILTLLVACFGVSIHNAQNITNNATITITTVVGNSTTVVGNSTTPFMVSLQKKLKSGKHQHMCGGTIIDEQFVLTAAHCFLKDSLDAKLFSIAAGTNQLYKQSALKRFEVKSVAMHRNFRPLFGSDIALIKVAPHFPLNDNQRFQKINFRENKKLGGLESVLVGWGRVATMEKPKALETLHFSTMLNTQCFDKGYVYLTSTEICAWNTRGRGACDGDSGGPLVSLDYKVLYGLLSYGKGVCKQNRPYAFTRISPFVKWIEATMKALLNSKSKKLRVGTNFYRI